jgi:small-conductance mechanosensitive channel
VYFLTNFFSHYYDWRIILEQIYYQISHANGAGVLPVVKSFFTDLWSWMTVRGNSTLAVGGLAVGVSMTYFVETIVGFSYLNKVTEVKLISWQETLKPLFLKIVNALIMATGMYFVFKIFDWQLDTTRTVWVALLTATTATYGGISYLLGSYLFKIKEFGHVKKYILTLYDNLKRRLKRRNEKGF